MINIFKKITADEIRRKQLQEAMCAALEHRAAAEHHQALADMYAGRAKRLEASPGVAAATPVSHHVI